MDLQNMQGQKKQTNKHHQLGVVAHLWMWCTPVGVVHTCNPLTGRGSQGFLGPSDQLVLN